MNGLAEPQQLPALLRQPPWLAAARAAEPPTLALPPLVQAARLRWTAEVREAARAAYDKHLWAPESRSHEYLLDYLVRAGVRPEALARLLAGAAVQADDFVDPPPTGTIYLPTLFYVPDVLAIGLWNALPSHRWDGDWDESLNSLIGRHGEAVVPGLLAYALRRPVLGLRACRWLDCPELATLALKVRRRLKVARQVATDWLMTHPQTSAAVLLRQLFGADAAEREDAKAALHELAAAGLRLTLDATAHALGPAADAAWQMQRDADPLQRLPASMPRLPAYMDPARLHRPRLKADGAGLPDDAMRHLALMLAISQPQSPYAGLDAVRDAFTPASLAEFVWELFEAWWAAGAPSSGAWALPALGLLGDTGTVHRMGARAMHLAREGAKNRAVALLDLLAAEGSDAALMHLDNLAERCKVPVVRNRATAQVNAVAEQRGLSRIELADRLVPTLGLDESRLLDFGPRQFHIGLDETLAPFVRDAQGTRLKDLPKPRLSDDREQADAAALRYKQLKTELKTLAKVQLARLEQAMVTRRRWALDDFRTFFVQHPLMREIAARLLWGVWGAGGQLLGACRIAEDGTLADAQDVHYLPPADVRLGIAHPVELSADLHLAFSDQFADYEILQPFPQLARETFALTAEEARGTKLLRVDGQDVATGAVIGLLDRGWLRGPTGDGGGIYTVLRPCGSTGLNASLGLDPGMHVMQLSSEPRQTLRTVQLLDAESRELPLFALDPISCSELLRDLYRLAPSAL
jgi:hypothetical protein